MTHRNPSYFVSRNFLNTNNVSLLHFRLMPESRIEHSPISWCSREQFVNTFFFLWFPSTRSSHSLGWLAQIHSHRHLRFTHNVLYSHKRSIVFNTSDGMCTTLYSHSVQYSYSYDLYVVVLVVFGCRRRRCCCTRQPFIACLL